MMGRFHPRARRRVKRGVVGLAASGVAFGLLSPIAMASTSGISWGKSNIEFTSYTAMNLPDFAEGGTTYMPIWYVLQALKNSGYSYSFNGKVINITTPSGVTPDTTGISLGGGNLTIEVNGSPVKMVDSKVQVDPSGGNKTQFIPIYYIQQILGALSFYNKWDGTTWTGRPVNANILGLSDLQVGQQDALLLTMTDANGNAVIPSGKVNWSVTLLNRSGTAGLGTGAAMDPNTGIFTATAAGTYLVTASTNGMSVSKKIEVYGQPAGVQLTESTSTLVTDGTATDTITVQVMDANNNPIPTFNGQVTLTIPTSGGTFVGGLTSGSLNSVPVYITNGTGTATLTAPTTNPGVTDLISTSNLTSLNQTVAAQVSYPSLPVSYVTPTAASISLTPNVSAVSTNSTSPDYLTATLNDAAGNALSSTYGAPVYVTFTLTGPGSFDPTGTSSSPVTTYSLYVYPGTTGVNIPIYSIANKPGTIQVTATGGGLSGSATVTSELNTAASAIQVTAQQETLTYPLYIGSTTLPAGTPFTLYTAQVVDSHGNPVPEQDTLSISDSTYNSANTPPDALYYYTVSAGQPSYGLTETSGSYSAETSGLTGQYQFIVLNTSKSSNPSQADITVTDQSTGASTTTPYTFH